MNTTLILSRGTDIGGQKAAFESSLAKSCAAHGLDVLIIPHLYHIQDDSGVWKTLAGITGKLAVAAWIYPRATQALLSRRGVGCDAITAFHLDGFETAEECLLTILNDLQITEAITTEGETREIDEPIAERWYPVIDYLRCTTCGNCLQFCIFDVYNYASTGEVYAANPDNCKTGCPACSRICPQGAIMFPLYLKDKAIAGAHGERIQPAAPKPEPQPNKDTLDDIDLLINDLENITRRKP